MGTTGQATARACRGTMLCRGDAVSTPEGPRACRSQEAHKGVAVFTRRRQPGSEPSGGVRAQWWGQTGADKGGRMKDKGGEDTHTTFG